MPGFWIFYVLGGLTLFSKLRSKKAAIHSLTGWFVVILFGSLLLARTYYKAEFLESLKLSLGMAYMETAILLVATFFFMLIPGVIFVIIEGTKRESWRGFKHMVIALFLIHAGWELAEIWDWVYFVVGLITLFDGWETFLVFRAWPGYLNIQKKYLFRDIMTEISEMPNPKQYAQEVLEQTGFEEKVK